VFYVILRKKERGGIMARAEKFGRNDLVPVLREAYRELKEGQYRNNVDANRSDKNYVIGCQDRKDLVKKMDERCNEIMDGKVNKKSKPLFSWVVTYPVHCPEIDEKAFFRAVNDFMVETYGKDNVMAVCVHMDEKTPHAHCFIVPEAISRKTGKRTVSVASLLDKEHLSAFHEKMDDFMYDRFKIRNTVYFGENTDRLENVSMLEHKQRMLEKENEELKTENDGLETRYHEKRQSFLEDLIRLKNERDQLQKENDELQDTVNYLKSMYNELMGKVKNLRNKFNWWAKSSDNLEVKRRSAEMKKEIEDEFPDLW
jgi:hypothetical protein